MALLADAICCTCTRVKIKFSFSVHILCIWPRRHCINSVVGVEHTDVEHKPHGDKASQATILVLVIKITGLWEMVFDILGRWRPELHHREKLFPLDVNCECHVVKFVLGLQQNLINTPLIHWGRVTHICVSKLTIIGSDNGLSPGRRQAIIWTNAELLFIIPLRTNFNEMFIEILIFSLMKMRLKVSSAKWHPFCLCLNVLGYQMIKSMDRN